MVKVQKQPPTKISEDIKTMIFSEVDRLKRDGMDESKAVMIVAMFSVMPGLGSIAAMMGYRRPTLESANRIVTAVLDSLSNEPGGC